MNRIVDFRTAGATTALALTVLLGGTPAPAAAFPLRPVYNFAQRATAQAMEQAALRAGIRIDHDIAILVSPEFDVAFATVDGFEKLDLRKDAREGATMGLLYLDGSKVLPRGYYVLVYVVNLDDSQPPGPDDAYALLVGRNGRQFRFPLALSIPDPNPGLGPRKGLAYNGGDPPSAGLSLASGAKLVVAETFQSDGGWPE